MDTPTTVVLAATAGAATFGKRCGPGAVTIFALGALVPDLDGFFLGDRLDYIRWHRATSHSLLFVLAAAPLLAGFGKLCRVRTDFLELTAIAAGGLLVAIGTDLLTWWGTMVLWPFSWTRYGVGVVFIVDLWLAALVTWPWLVWPVQAVRGRPFPLGAFRTATALALLYLLVCWAARESAVRSLHEVCRAEGDTPVDVFPQPLSPFRWSLVRDAGDRYHQTFVDVLGGEALGPERTFPKNEGGPATLTDATETGQTLLWFHKVPVREVTRNGDHVEVVYRDLAYEAWLPPWFPWRRSVPFRYRFALERGRITERGWVR